jgi:prepilin-type N-terminal cleavage/methylation domain-containing protein
MRQPRGFTLIEVLVASALVGVALLSGSWAMSVTASSKSIVEGAPITAALIGREIHALACTLDKSPSGVSGVTSGALVQALDALEGAVFSPPIKADKSSWSQYSGWSQSVDLAVYDLSDLSTPTLDDPLLGLSEDGTRIYRLTVGVAEGNELVGTYHWWITP